MFFTVHGRGPLGADRGLLKYNQNTSRGWLIGVIGDRVNDALALKWANVDIRCGSEAGAAQSAAEIVLTGLESSVIVQDIDQWRKIFQRMENSVFCCDVGRNDA